ncbi:MAG: hypothetical protein QOH17_4541 [Pseudonocardiales bacterium]|nr:hypothetical protein [Pseudonocardiales bacterium]
MTTRGRVAVLAACALVAALVAWYAAARSPAPAAGPPPGSVRLGPDPDEAVSAYLTRAARTLPSQGVSALALVQLVDELTVGDPLPQGTPVEAVFRVDLPRVQTALRFMPLEPGVPTATALDSARQRAASAATGDAGRLTGRAKDIATAEAKALGRPDCACLVALVVSADGAALRQPGAGVRVVEAAPPGVTLRELALSPLLPEQTERADPLPDDGRVP